ncbi:MAG TPA: sn-glycerol-3-phosphate ABC transporter ATP-binding protein UgpC [Jatrophihabitantaceae bacterium]|nr:sn-glycerol-3-phosphate ABC transporter ATP-binding protein UgpC [Jatrophihabitantaceae bacterium]
MAGVKFIDATRVYPGATVPSVNKLNLDIPDGEFCVLVGPSGSGKSTALRMLAGLEDVDLGAIYIGDRDVSNLPPKERDIAMVFQNYALYPHMSVAENMGFALKLKGVNKAERDAKVREAARLLDLEPYLDRKPKALSGGQRQRVAMGRAIVREPSVFLMDEPLSNLDAKLRVETRANIAALQARLGTTTLYVTHDQVEAMTMGHRVAILKEGGFLQQVDTPRNLYDKPINAFVAGFIGSPAMNLRPATLVPGGAKVGNIVVALHADAEAEAKKANLSKVLLGVRPESFHVGANPDVGLEIKVNLVEELGADAYIYGELTGDPEVYDKQYIVRFDGRVPPRIGDIIHVEVREGEEHVFNPDTGERIGGAAQDVFERPA